MTFQEFDKLQLQLFDDILKIAKTKGVEYASSEDRLANFKRLGVELDIPATKIGYIFFKKHLDSICTYLKDGKEHSEESIRGRFLDAINYLTLIYGLIVESNLNLHSSVSNQEKSWDGVTRINQTVWMDKAKSPMCSVCRKPIMYGEAYTTMKDSMTTYYYHETHIRETRNDKTEETRTSTENK